MVARLGALSRIEAVRRFNRLYTRRIGVLQPGYLGSAFPLPQARLLYELGQRGECTASELGADLDLDLGYLSRLLQGLRRQGLVQGEASKQDARRVHLALTAKGRRAYLSLDARSREEVGALLGKLAAPQQARLVGALQTVEKLLASDPSNGETIALRGHRPGDMGWVIHAHGRLYFEEYGWDERFEALVAGIAADFVKNFDSERERCWIAEMNGENVGCVMLVKDDQPNVARLRLLLVDPKARRLGLGARLVDECVRFARARGYAKVTLWTHSVLSAARHVYEGAGFKLTSSEPRRSWGKDVVAEFWDLEL